VSEAVVKKYRSWAQRRHGHLAYFGQRFADSRYLDTNVEVWDGKESEWERGLGFGVWSFGTMGRALRALLWVSGVRSRNII